MESENNKNMIKSDEELMESYKLGDVNALEELFTRYRKPILNYSLRVLRNLADAEDVVGEAFYAVTFRKDTYNAAGKFSTWLYTIAHNACVDRIRKRCRVVFLWFQKESDDTCREINLPDTKITQDLACQENDRAEFVKKALGKLPCQYREAIVLREYQGLNYEEIAGIMSCSLAKVKVLIFRGREKLRKILLPLAEELR